MIIQEINPYNEIINSNLIQTTIQSIQSLVYRIFINPSEQCLLGHILVIGFLSSFNITPGGMAYCFILFELLFTVVQQARQLYHSIQSIVRQY